MICLMEKRASEWQSREENAAKDKYFALDGYFQLNDQSAVGWLPIPTTSMNKQTNRKRRWNKNMIPT